MGGAEEGMCSILRAADADTSPVSGTASVNDFLMKPYGVIELPSTQSLILI